MKKTNTSNGLRAELTEDIRGFKAPVLARTVLKQGLVAELVACALDADELLSSRAMWVLGHCADADYEAVRPHHLRLIKNLESAGLHNGVIRNTLRLFQEHPVPESQQAFMLDTCYAYLNDRSQAIAVRAFAIRVVFNLSAPYPELLAELKTVLLHLAEEEEAPGVRSRVRNTLKAIDRLQRVKKRDPF